MTEKICSICGGTERVTKAPVWLIKYDGTWCHYCFLAWYDYNQTNTNRIKEISLRLQKERAKQ